MLGCVKVFASQSGVLKRQAMCRGFLTNSCESVDCFTTITTYILVTLRSSPGFFRGFLCQARTVVNDYSTTVGNLTQFGTRVIMNQICGNVSQLSIKTC